MNHMNIACFSANRETYPQTADLRDTLIKMCAKDTGFDETQCMVAMTALHNVIEYEHGTADIADVSPARGMTIEQYVHVVIDLILSIGGEERPQESGT